MLKREDIQNIFSMYIDGVSIDEINNIYQKKLDEFCEELELGRGFLPNFDSKIVLTSFRVVHKNLVTEETFEFVQRLLEADKNNN